MDEIERAEAALRGTIRGLTEPAGRSTRIDGLLGDVMPEGGWVRLHTDPPDEAVAWAAWGPAGSEAVEHWSIWDAPADRPRRIVGRPLRWLGEALVRLGTRRAKLLGTWEKRADD